MELSLLAFVPRSMLVELASLALLAQAAAPDLVAPRAPNADETKRGVFDSAWVLPATLPFADERSSAPAVDLETHVKELLARRWDAPDGSPRCLGDVARAWRRAGETSASRERVLADLRSTNAEVARELEPLLRELLQDDVLRSPKWDPERDDARDGIAFARALTLGKRTDAPWAKLDGSKLVQQACVLVFADLAAIKNAENDYRNYPRRAGSSYESIHPARDSYVRGVDDQGRAFAALLLQFRCDLPFPFSDYRCDLSIWNRIGEDGVTRCDIVSKSRDFLWLAGSDLYLPVLASDGELVGTCIVRRFGFDLRGVPDGDDARKTGLRSSLGNLKLESEALQRKRADALRASDGQLPEFEVRGGR